MRRVFKTCARLAIAHKDVFLEWINKQYWLEDSATQISGDYNIIQALLAEEELLKQQNAIKKPED